jgi:hypothetical protein
MLFGLLVTSGLAATGRLLAAPAFPLTISTNNRHLVDQNGVPFLVNGDTPWSLMTGISKSDAEFYLENRRQKGFNAILVNLIEHYYNGPVNQEGEAPFTTAGDFSTPNEKYFAHCDWVINKAAEKGILVMLTPAYMGFGCGEEGWCLEMIENGTAKMRDYGRYVGTRYRDFPNIIWVAAGDVGVFGVAFDVLEAMVEGIREVDTVHLFTAHCSRGWSAIDCYNEPWLDVNNTYSDCTNSASRSLDDYNRGRLLPFFYIEGRYEGEGASGVCLRSQAYWSVLSGSTGHFYGNYPMWPFDPWWKQALDSSAAGSMIHLRNLFQSREWHKLVPDQTHQVLTSGYGSLENGDYAASALTSNSNTFIAYLPSRREVTVDMSKISGNEVNVWWFDPSEGEATLFGTFTTSGSRILTPSSGDDWVLVIDNAALSLPAPGMAAPQPPTNLRVIK